MCAMRRAVRLRHLLWPPFRLSFGSGLGRCGKKSSFLVFVKLSGLGARARCVEQSRFRGPLLGLCDDRVIAARRSQSTLTPLTRATSPQLIIPDSTRRIHGRNTCPCLCWASTPRRIKCSPFVGQVPGPCLALTSAEGRPCSRAVHQRLLELPCSDIRWFCLWFSVSSSSSACLVCAREGGTSGNAGTCDRSDPLPAVMQDQEAREREGTGGKGLFEEERQTPMTAVRGQHHHPGEAHPCAPRGKFGDQQHLEAWTRSGFFQPRVSPSDHPFPRLLLYLSLHPSSVYPFPQASFPHSTPPSLTQARPSLPGAFPLPLSLKPLVLRIKPFHLHHHHVPGMYQNNVIPQLPTFPRADGALHPPNIPRRTGPVCLEAVLFGPSPPQIVRSHPLQTLGFGVRGEQHQARRQSHQQNGWPLRLSSLCARAWVGGRVWICAEGV